MADDLVKTVVKYTSATSKADKVSKSIGFGCATLARVIEFYAAKPTRHSVGLGAVASQISYARYVTRFTGIFECIEALQNDSWTYADDDPRVRQLVKLQVYSMLLYYPLEHVSFVGFVAPKWFNVDAMRAMRQSCMAWTVYVVLDMYANHLRLTKLAKREKMLEAKIIDEANPDAVAERATELATIQSTRQYLIINQWRNVLFLPNCIHWSSERGIIPEVLVQFLGFAEGVLGIWQTWPH
ncbi:hypothetical protein SDRG_03336 [Saprolegnia diclina VS20]|uniref:Uncharacterized protein n=1 Tax=Saprolegnia diclina (strain VS20) TaxID=1156394 RepID=T0S2E7_SAPDV|nr:hypothetical protein SDRG_03336 [Saprolegnia diclina VS20]EQC39128.1 hypothetical protein SDRG_03336 [Saprolegnia diclina VS20]|eukprot:XP_008607189.1 hypothetical protein SDRG_03336 [Saprolegnia diclina VS20]